ncbi:hypothetical protein V6N13_084186 [Hibiscus sabdariffa]
MPHLGNPHTSGSMKNQETILGLASSGTNEQDRYGKVWHRLIVALSKAIRFQASFDHNLVNDLITITDLASLDHSRHGNYKSFHQDYTQTWHHRVRMDKSLPFKLANLRFEGSEPCSRFAG